MRQVKWTLNDGRTATITVSLQTERTISADGDVATVPCCEIHIVGEVAGVVMGDSADRLASPRRVGTSTVVGRCGGLGIREQQMAEIEAAIAEIKSTPEWIENERRQAEARRESAKYEAHRDRMRRVMGY